MSQEDEIMRLRQKAAEDLNRVYGMLDEIMVFGVHEGEPLIPHMAFLIRRLAEEIKDVRESIYGR